MSKIKILTLSILLHGKYARTCTAKKNFFMSFYYTQASELAMNPPADMPMGGGGNATQIRPPAGNMRATAAPVPRTDTSNMTREQVVDYLMTAHATS